MSRLLLAILFWACCTAPLHALDITKLQPEGYVSDFAKVLSAQQRQEVERYCGRVEASTGAQIAVVLLPSLDEEPIEDVANALFRQWKIGREGENNGLLLLLAVNDRRSRIEVGYGLEPVLPDGFDGGVLRQMRPALRANDYGEAILEGVNAIGSRIAEAKGVSLESRPPRRPAPSSDSIPWPLIVFGSLFILFLLGRRGGGGGRGRGGYTGGGGGGFLPGLILGQVLGRAGSHGGYRGGGGGFGGWDSGDSFGGFGGGDSGGGGASSDW